jgi:hypothetical protein
VFRAVVIASTDPGAGFTEISEITGTNPVES